MKPKIDLRTKILRNLSKGPLTEDEVAFPADPNTASRTLEFMVARGEIRLEINQQAVGAKRRVYRRA